MATWEKDQSMLFIDFSDTPVSYTHLGVCMVGHFYD